jgi:hypothetical protein
MLRVALDRGVAMTGDPMKAFLKGLRVMREVEQIERDLVFAENQTARHPQDARALAGELERLRSKLNQAKGARTAFIGLVSRMRGEDVLRFVIEQGVRIRDHLPERYDT